MISIAQWHHIFRGMSRHLVIREVLRNLPRANMQLFPPILTISSELQIKVVFSFQQCKVITSFHSRRDNRVEYRIGSAGEAAFMTGLERNSDIVFAASYAPLLQHVNSTQWVS